MRWSHILRPSPLPCLKKKQNLKTIYLYMYNWITLTITSLSSEMNIFFFYFILLYNTVLVLPYIHKSATGVHDSQSWTSLLPPSPYHLSGSSPCTSPKQAAPYVRHGLAIQFIYDIIHVSMPFSQIIPPSSSPTESKRLFYTSVSLLLSRIQGYRYHLSKFHI